MSIVFLVRPMTLLLVTCAIAACGSVFAATASAGNDAATPATPPVPDVQAIVAQAKEFARHKVNDAMLLAFDEELLALPSSMAFVASEFGPPREIVKNAPYTADAITESIQVLADGNRIVKKSTTLLARDGVGRTRQERKSDGRGSVFIFDPIDGRSVVLNESSRTATRIPRVPTPPSPPAPLMPPAGTVPPAPPIPPAGAMPPGGVPMAGVPADGQPGRVIVRRNRTADGAAQEDVRVEVVRVGRGEGAGAMPPPPMPPLTLPLLPRGKGETKSLGTREFDGVKADGTVTTHTIAAGEIGNEKAIVVSSERWFSPELHIVVFAKTVDPRAGETIYRLTNVKRGEPPAEMFRVPADYKVRGEPRNS